LGTLSRFLQTREQKAVQPAAVGKPLMFLIYFGSFSRFSQKGGQVFTLNPIFFRAGEGRISHFSLGVDFPGGHETPLIPFALRPCSIPS
jgi:hypothetical protein